MSNKRAADTSFNISEIVSKISTFIDDSDETSLSYLSRTNRCAYLSLQRDRGRIIACRVENVPSLSQFLNRQLSNYGRILCRSLEIIAKEGFHLDPRDSASHSSLESVFKLIGENQALNAFAYRTATPNCPQEFVCAPPRIWDSLRTSSGNLQALNIVTHACNWPSVFRLSFSGLRSLQLVLSFSTTPFRCRKVDYDPKENLWAVLVPRFLQRMEHLTHLVLSLRKAEFDPGFEMTDLHFPALIAIDISASTAPRGLIRFTANHPNLVRLHLHFKESTGQGQFRPQHLPMLRALKLREENSGTFATFLGRPSESVEHAFARRPHIEHFFIYTAIPGPHREHVCATRVVGAEFICVSLSFQPHYSARGK
ncbi:hypothetical protein SCHPADRAFT_931097, partial [Schizopora paradoxa]